MSNEVEGPALLSRAEMQRIDGLSEEELNRLPFGAIRLDTRGVVQAYNASESRAAGRHPALVVGRNFFAEVAPCTNVQSFAGKFREGVAKGELHEVFPYRFDFEMAPRDVTVTLFYSRVTDCAWVFVRERLAGV